MHPRCNPCLISQHFHSKSWNPNKCLCCDGIRWAARQAIAAFRSHELPLEKEKQLSLGRKLDPGCVTESTWAKNGLACKGSAYKMGKLYVHRQGNTCTPSLYAAHSHKHQHLSAHGLGSTDNIFSARGFNQPRAQQGSCRNRAHLLNKLSSPYTHIPPTAWVAQPLRQHWE